MKQILQSLRVCALALCALACTNSWAATTSNDGDYVPIDDRSVPQALIRTATEEVQSEIRTRAIEPDDTARIADIVDRDILPYMDVRRTTRLAMGRYWRIATPAQQDKIVVQFQSLLIHTYSGALAMLAPEQKFQYPLVRMPLELNDTVVCTIAIYNGQPVEIDYRLYRSSDGWRVYDIDLLGVWLVQVYRYQFDEEIGKHGISGLIALLTARNQALTAASTTMAGMASRRRQLPRTAISLGTRNKS